MQKQSREAQLQYAQKVGRGGVVGGGNEAVTGCGDRIIWLSSQSQNESILWANMRGFPAAPYCSWTPYRVPDKLPGQKLTFPDWCQQKYHLSRSVSSCNQVIRFFAQVWRRLSAESDESEVTELPWCRGLRGFQIIFRSPTEHRIFTGPNDQHLGSKDLLKDLNCLENNKLMASDSCQ